LEGIKQVQTAMTALDAFEIFVGHVGNGNEPMTPKDFLEKLYLELDEDERCKKYDSVI
jgi:hypothetical protein